MSKAPLPTDKNASTRTAMQEAVPHHKMYPAPRVLNDLMKRKKHSRQNFATKDKRVGGSWAKRKCSYLNKDTLFTFVQKRMIT